MEAFKAPKTQLDDECKNLTSILNGMTIKAKKIINEEGKAKKAHKYETISFAESDSERCRKSILQVLKIIFEINMISEIESKLNLFSNWSENINEIYEEEKEDINSSISK